MQALFCEATIADLIESNPCILKTQHLGKIRDKRHAWRDGAVYSREELASLLWDPRIPLGRRVHWGLLGVACLRVGEAAGLRWERLDLAYDPLGRLSVVTSYDNDKTETERWMPLHPSLAGLLAEWRLSGWSATFGRQPELEDLVVPVLPEPRRKGRVRWPGSMLDKNWVLKRLRMDLGLLEARQRRVHDLQRTGISLAIEDGADEAILKHGTHAPPRHVMALYTSVAWKTLCREVVKLRLERRAPGAVVALRSAGPALPAEVLEGSKEVVH